ncbi:MAG: hypothetical protein HN392_09690 [Anaerolineae bacterium]|jgi:immune inhibitor A|nr:hypothetical protein [Anaerolineae bacterium]MBT7782302.1 hypothetical protein [Anaerolineae bacterium]
MQEKKSSTTKTVWIIVGVIITLLCCCLIILGGAAYWIAQNGENIVADIEESLDIPTALPTKPIIVDNTPAGEVPVDTREVLENTIIPIRDMSSLSERLENKTDIPETLLSGPFFVGDQQEFWVTNVSTNVSFQITATLEALSPHAYFWIENGTKFDKKGLEEVANTFETEVYPTNRDFFGSEWTPGVDGDPHIYILYASNLGSGLGGYFSSMDEYHPLAHEYSNAHEMFVIQTIYADYGEGDLSTLAHEFQHMIHWYRDFNEESWMNEGFSVLAEFLNGYPAYFDSSYIANTDTQLNDWSQVSGENGPHYGAGFLYTNYFLNRFGENATKALVASEQNGFESVELVLEEINAVDSRTGQTITADNLFIDWLLANYLQDSNVGDGRYTYNNYPTAPQASATESVYSYPYTQNYSVHQYGGDYILIDCEGDYTIHFDGATQTGLLPSDPYSGIYAFWTNKGDESNMTLTRDFDFSDVAGEITLSFQTWYDIETDYDYVYLEVSEDGENWDIITTPLGTDEDPSGNSYGFAFNGFSGGWVQENADLSAYAGKEVQVRFEYVTDAAVNGEGMLIDDIRIEAVDYFSDFESDNSGWDAKGFVRVQNILPQSFQVALILKGDETTVEIIELSDEQTADIHVSMNGEYNTEAILVVTGTTRFTRELANYSIEIK